MRRYRTNRRKDRSIFKRTASTTRAINVSPKSMRGGIRL